MVKIVIIEDEAAIAAMYEMELQAAGFTIGVAGDGKAGLDLCQELKPDMVLLDLMLPQMSGLQVLEKIRATEWGKDTLVIMLTNLSQGDAKLQADKHRFDAYAVKAYYTPRQLREKVVELLKASRKLPQDWTPKS